MFLINPILTPNQLTNNGLNDILHQIDDKIFCLVTTQYMNQVFGFTGSVDLKYYEDLCNIKEILLDKLLGCNCMDDEHLVYIISETKSLINKF